MGARNFTNCVLIVLILLGLIGFGSFNFLTAAPHDAELEKWCDGLASDEIIIKFKTENSSMQRQKDFNLAPKFTEDILAYQKGKDFNHIKKNYALTVEGNNALDFEEDDKSDVGAAFDQKHQRRKERLLRSRAKYNLDRIYSIKVSGNQMLQQFMPAKQKRLYACSELRKTIAKLNNDPSVEYAEADLRLKPQAEITDGFYAQGASTTDWPYKYETQWGLRKVNADKVWSKTQGKNVIVAVIDSGVNYNNADLWNNIWVNPALVKDNNRDGKRTLDDLDLNKNKIIDASEIKTGYFGFNFGSKNDPNPMDTIGHGTHVAGIIAASIDGAGMVGIAPQAQIMPVKVVDSQGGITEKNVAKAIIVAAKYGADVANISMGTSMKPMLIYDAILAVRDDMLIVAASGNYNRDLSGSGAIGSSFYPASFDEVLSVAAITETEQKAYFSNYGLEVDIAAPGGADSKYDKNILSTDLTASGYGRRVGTSMASPYVAGVAALVLGAKPSLSPASLQKVLIDSAYKLNTAYDLGAGLVDAQAAVAN